ncbi:unnamed protein product, partial [Iphiclides podalirius]
MVLRVPTSDGKISKNKHGITFHRFPQDKTRKGQWEIAVNREQGWRATPSSTVCSEHFNANDFYLTDSGLRRLSLTSIPSINISPCQDEEPTICVMDPGDIKPTDSEERASIVDRHRISLHVSPMLAASANTVRRQVCQTDPKPVAPKKLFIAILNSDLLHAKR